MELLGVLAIIVGIIGMIVMLKGRKPHYPSATDSAKGS